MYYFVMLNVIFHIQKIILSFDILISIKINLKKTIAFITTYMSEMHSGTKYDFVHFLDPN